MDTLNGFRSDVDEATNDKIRATLPGDILEELEQVRHDAHGRTVLCFHVRSLIDPDEIPFTVVDDWSALIREKTGLYESRETGRHLQEITIK